MEESNESDQSDEADEAGEMTATNDTNESSMTCKTLRQWQHCNKHCQRIGISRTVVAAMLSVQK